MSQVMPASGDADDGRLGNSSSDTMDSQTLHDTVAAGRTDFVPRFSAFVRLLPLHLHEQPPVEQPQQLPQPCPVTAAVTAGTPSSRYTEAARLQAGRTVKATDWWTLYPHELQAKILRHAGPLTQLLCGHLNVAKMDDDAKRALWIDGFEQDWSGDLALLPNADLLVKDFVHVSSRSMYHRLWARFPLYVMPDNPFYDAYIDIRDGMCSIPMRHMWLDCLPPLPHDYLARVAVEGDHAAFLEYMLDKKLVPLEMADDIDDYGLSSRIDAAAQYGSLGVIKLLSARGARATSKAMDSAAEGGHLDTVKWLHEHRTEGCTAKAMDNAAFGGHLHVLQWLQEHRTEGCTTWAMNWAATNGHLDAVKWLHEHRTEGCTTWAMDKAAEMGHLDVLKLLHEHRTEGCTTNAIDAAAGNGQLDVVEWLHEHRAEGCTTNAIDAAAGNGHLHVVQWLLANRTEGFTRHAMAAAADDNIARLLAGSLSAEQRAAMTIYTEHDGEPDFDGYLASMFA